MTLTFLGVAVVLLAAFVLIETKVANPLMPMRVVTERNRGGSYLGSLVAQGELTDKLARQVVEGVIAGEGSPAQVIAARGIKVVNDDGALMAAIEKVCLEQSETADKVRNGHLPAAGALIGAVMKETKGQADAARVRELLLGHLGQA